MRSLVCLILDYVIFLFLFLNNSFNFRENNLWFWSGGPCRYEGRLPNIRHCKTPLRWNYSQVWQPPWPFLGKAPPKHDSKFCTIPFLRKNQTKHWAFCVPVLVVEIPPSFWENKGRRIVFLISIIYTFLKNDVELVAIYFSGITRSQIVIFLRQVFLNGKKRLARYHGRDVITIFWSGRYCFFFRKKLLKVFDSPKCEASCV